MYYRNLYIYTIIKNQDIMTLNYNGVKIEYNSFKSEFDDFLKTYDTVLLLNGVTVARMYLSKKQLNEVSK